MFATPNPSGLENVSYRGYRKQRNPRGLLRRVHVEILNLPKLRSLLSAKTGHNGDAFIALPQQSDGSAGDRCRGGVRDIGVRYAHDIRAVRINLNPHLRTVGRPIISQHGNPWSLTQNIHRPRRNSSQCEDVRRFILNICIGLTGDKNFNWRLDRIRLELPHGDPCARYLSAEG